MPIPHAMHEVFYYPLEKSDFLVRQKNVNPLFLHHQPSMMILRQEMDVAHLSRKVFCQDLVCVICH